MHSIKLHSNINKTVIKQKAKMANIGDTYRMPKGHEQELQKLNKNYSIGKVVGKGAFGLVCTGTMSRDNKTEGMAVKIINLMKADDIYIEKFMEKELKALKEIKHDFIVTVFWHKIRKTHPLCVYGVGRGWGPLELFGWKVH